MKNCKGGPRTRPSDKTIKEKGVRKINSAAIAAEVRGFNLRTPASGYKEYPFSGKDVLAMVLCLALIALALAINVLPALF